MLILKILYYFDKYIKSIPEKYALINPPKALNPKNIETLFAA